MQLECELCGAHYKADIADAHVLGGRLTFTCKSCGKEVVVVGGSDDRSRRAGILLPDQGDEVFGISEPPRAEEGAGTPLEGVEAAGTGLDVFVEPAVPLEIPPDMAALTARPAVPDEAAAPSDPGPVREPRPEAPGPFLPVPERKGPSPILLGIGILAVVAIAFVLFVRPMLSGKPEAKDGPTVPAQAPVAAPAPSPIPPLAQSPAPPTAVPTPEQAPSVQIRELARPPEVKPSPVPTAKKEAAIREAASVIDPGLIQEALIRVRPIYRLCAVAEVTRDPEAKPGTVAASVTILPNGAVSKVVLDRPELANSPLGQCVRDALAKMTFPAFEGSPAVLRQSIDLTVTSGR